jgi:twitching motility two-component system response regulator PilG
VTQLSSTRLLDVLRQAISAAKAGRKADAQRLLRAVTEGDPSNELAWLWLAGVASSPQDALAALQRVLEINPANAQALRGLSTTRLQIGIAEARAGRKRTARRYLLDLARHEPENELAWLWLGGVAETPQDAVNYLERVLQLNPENHHAREGLQTVRLEAGIAEARAGNHIEARCYLHAVTSAEPTHELAWHWLAEVADTPGEAMSFLERALEINPRNELALETFFWYRLRLDASGACWQCPFCQCKGRPLDDACSECGAVLTLADLAAFFGRRTLRAEKIEAALTELQGSAGPALDFPALYQLGLGCLNLGRLDEAIHYFAAALESLPDFPRLAPQLAALRERQRALENQASEERRRRRCVLVVDDSPTVRKLVSLTLEKEGYRVVTSAEAVEAQQRIREEIPDLILLDITMPGMDGYQLCKLFKADRQAAHVPVVMLSGKDGFFDKIRGRMAGSTEYVTKPFKPEALLEVTRRHCLKRPG